MTTPVGNPADGSYWKMAVNTPHFEFAEGRIFCYGGIVDVFGPEEDRHAACYSIKRWTNTKTAHPSIFVDRDLFFKWFVPYILTDEDLGRNRPEDVKQRIRQRLLNHEPVPNPAPEADSVPPAGSQTHQGGT